MSDTLLPLLLIDDNQTDITFVVRALKKSGFKNPVISVTTAKEAEDFLGEKVPQSGGTLPALIILDLRLPGRPGLEMLVWIRAQKHLASVPVLVYSGFEDPTVINRAYSAGANAYVPKDGFDATTLCERASGLLSGGPDGALAPGIG